VALNIGRVTISSPGMEGATSWSVAPHRSCRGPIDTYVDADQPGKRNRYSTPNHQSDTQTPYFFVDATDAAVTSTGLQVTIVWVICVGSCHDGLIAAANKSMIRHRLSWRSSATLRLVAGMPRSEGCDKQLGIAGTAVRSADSSTHP
jgi:hypothetical protein